MRIVGYSDVPFRHQSPKASNVGVEGEQGADGSLSRRSYATLGGRLPIPRNNLISLSHEIRCKLFCSVAGMHEVDEGEVSGDVGLLPFPNWETLWLGNG